MVLQHLLAALVSFSGAGAAAVSLVPAWSLGGGQMAPVAPPVVVAAHPPLPGVVTSPLPGG